MSTRLALVVIPLEAVKVNEMILGAATLEGAEEGIAVG